MKKLFIFILIPVIVFCTKSVAGDYVVGVENLDYLPYYSGVNDSYKGYAKDLLDAFAKNNGHTFTYRALPVRRLFKSLMNETIDFKFPDNPDWQSEIKNKKKVIYSNTTLMAIDGVMVLPGQKGKGIKNLKNLGTVMGFTPWTYKESIDKGEIIVSENPSFKGLLTQVIKGRISGAYINTVVADYQLKTVLKKPGALVFDPELPFDKNSYLLSTIKHKEVLDSFNQFLSKNQGFIKRLKSKYNIVEEQ